jgi:hypothetical protein
MNASTLVTRNPERSLTVSDRVARGLGWFSLGLGLAEIVAPGRLAKLLGLEGKENLLRGYGAREVGAGVWALSTSPAPAIWSRVAGDLVDLGTLALGARHGDDEQRRNAAIAIVAVAGITLVDAVTAVGLTNEQRQAKGEQRDYGDRTGFPSGPAAAKGAAKDFETPAEMKVAPALADA